MTALPSFELHPSGGVQAASARLRGIGLARELQRLGCSVSLGQPAALLPDVLVVQKTSSPALVGFVPTFANAGTNPGIDSNPNPATVVLASDSAENLTIDFGYIPAPAGTIGDFVWKDVNGDGIQGASDVEPGII